MTKLDLTKAYKAYFSAKTKPETVVIETAKFISIRGKGDPSESAFAKTLQALYATAYALKFHYKESGDDFTVSKLEGQWWFDEEKFGFPSISETPRLVPRREWDYRMLIRMPVFVTETDVKKIIQSVKLKKDIPLIETVAYYEMEEGLSIQLLHVGPFETEPESLSKIQEYATAHNLDKNGLHHEIYLSDFRKTPPSKLKTILREPVKVKAN
ncbi:hypothetical protein DYBT9275_01053 [Dyadobacter sp. CECT 9275]|uniref:GyrI-like small molecule binding domain-containing protein n=1 Tax=Dyadobacter helix TaxID=2822344 RepID=A0A916J883_9BACT|nr:GyrI-like domain-containing protein [Dyadobacter sp. CECT 9275]CAG4992847.1 hypothetical protein DYBT9275_01053 [Dyadobacter sp. CECT 9275]